MKIRASLLAFAVLAGAGAQAHAATKPKPKPIPPVCNLVTDPAGDAAGVGGSPAGAGDPALDITSVDVATDAKNLTGVVRVKKLAATTTNAPTGMAWTVLFSAGGVDFSIAGHADPQGKVTYDAAYQATTGGSILGAVTGAFDTTKNEVRITAPLSMLAAQADIKPGSKITAIGGQTGQEVLVPDATGVFGGGTFASDSVISDDTTGGKDYTAGRPSCVKVGA